MITQIKQILRNVTIFLLWIHKVSEYLKQILGGKKRKTVLDASQNCF